MINVKEIEIFRRGIRLFYVDWASRVKRLVKSFIVQTVLNFDFARNKFLQIRCFQY